MFLSPRARLQQGAQRRSSHKKRPLTPATTVETPGAVGWKAIENLFTNKPVQMNLFDPDDDDVDEDAGEFTLYFHASYIEGLGKLLKSATPREQVQILRDLKTSLQSSGADLLSSDPEYLRSLSLWDSKESASAAVRKSSKKKTLGDYELLAKETFDTHYYATWAAKEAHRPVAVVTATATNFVIPRRQPTRSVVIVRLPPRKRHKGEQREWKEAENQLSQ